MVTSAADSPVVNPAASNDPNLPRKNLSSPWSHVVRGADSEPINNQSFPLQPQSSSSSSLDSANLVAAAAAITAVAAIAVDNSNADKNNNNAGNPKKPAWKNASNGVVADVSPVMGAVSWPALSAKSSAKFTSDSSSVVAEGSISIPQGHITSTSLRKQAAATANANVKPTPPINHGVANRQKSMKRGGGNSGSNEPAPFPNNFSNPPYINLQPLAPPPPYPVVQIPPNTLFPDGVSSYRSSNGWSPRSPVGGYGPHVDEHRNPSRRVNYGNRPHNNSGIRRNQDPGNIVNARDAHAHQHRMHSGGFVRPTLHNSPSYLGSPSMRPYVNTFGFHEFYYYPTVQFEQFGGMPFLTHPPPPAMFLPVPETLETPVETTSAETPVETTSAETPLTNLILKQIEYYFSDINLARDGFLKFNMDEQGWVPITLIANFPRVQKLTNDIELILDSLRTSKIVEVHGDKMRRRNELMRCLPSAHQNQLASSGSVSPSGSSCNNIVADFDKITLDEATGHKISNATTNVGSA